MDSGSSNKSLYLNNEIVTEIEIPNTITEIKDYAFYGCSSLTSIEIPDSVMSIGSVAFYNCSSLTSVMIGNGVTSIGDEAFYNCSSLTSIEIPDSVTSIGTYAFYNCSSLTSVYITDIGAWCNISGLSTLMAEGSSNKNLYLNNEIVTEIEIPNTITEIKDYAFYGCSSLTSIEIPDSVMSIGFCAFWYCNSLTRMEIPNSVTSIGSGAFSGCSSLTYNTKNGLKYLGNSNNPYLYLVGTGNTSITTATIDSNCKFIGASAFADCSSLTSMVIPNSVTSIDRLAFSKCSNLTSITFKDTATWYRTQDSSAWYNQTGGTITKLTSSSANATYFKATWKGYYWYKL